MSLIPQNPFPKGTKKVTKFSSEVPKELDIFFRSEPAFYPKGKMLEDMTLEEKKKAQEKYRFDPMRTGIYQTLSGLGKMI
jgi:hypothetical protein